MKNNSIIICGGISNEIMVWNRNNSNRIKVIITHPQLIFINSLLNLNNQNLFASASTDSKIIIYDLNNDYSIFQQITENETHLLKLCNVYQNDFCLSTMQGKIHYYKWNINQYEKNYTFIGSNDKQIYDILQLKNGYLISVDNNEDIKVWDLENKQCVTIIKDNNENNLVIQLNDGRICTASSNKIIKIWDFNYYN
jgi:WD40 repeat protein